MHRLYSTEWTSNRRQKPPHLALRGHLPCRCPFEGVQVQHLIRKHVQCEPLQTINMRVDRSEVPYAHGHNGIECRDDSPVLLVKPSSRICFMPGARTELCAQALKAIPCYAQCQGSMMNCQRLKPNGSITSRTIRQLPNWMFGIQPFIGFRRQSPPRKQGLEWAFTSFQLLKS